MLGGSDPGHQWEKTKKGLESEDGHIAKGLHHQQREL